MKKNKFKCLLLISLFLINSCSEQNTIIRNDAFFVVGIDSTFFNEYYLIQGLLGNSKINVLSSKNSFQKCQNRIHENEYLYINLEKYNKPVYATTNKGSGINYSITIDSNLVWYKDSIISTVYYSENIQGACILK